MPRIAVVRKERCNPIGCGNFLCIRVCPVNREGKDCITKDEPSGKVKVDPYLCIGCQICVVKCPFDVFYITNLPDDLCKQPIHQYGINGFKLYSLPTPVFGKVVGILGRNGIGKSTAIRILSGIEKPNLGKDEPQPFDEVIKFFKGSEAQRFFEQVRDGDMKVSYKPQQVDVIAKARGTVRELLEKVDEKGELGKIAEILDLNQVMDNDVSTLSGGELQRVAIAATVLKKANLYVFDEPTSYLDIKQRFKIARFIKTLASPETAVLVVEHDLIILDAMTDLIHIMYGKETAYGIVSQPRATRTGINSYLSGNLREENMRFRENEIKFFQRQPVGAKNFGDVASWRSLKKKLGNFEFESGEGRITKNEVVGILGENGIGKTTFVKILARVHEPDEGIVDQKVAVAYKPQYLPSDSTELVMTVLGDAIRKHEMQILKPFDLKHLMTKQLNQLSGGELQRVAIAATLAKEADLYLLDEPSAYLDVEQRMIISKAIRELAETRGSPIMIVDHDLMFMDHLCDRLIVFEGKPAVKGSAKGPYSMEEGMNNFLANINLTFRRDEESRRPRLNKPDSVADREQKAKNKRYYA